MFVCDCAYLSKYLSFFVREKKKLFKVIRKFLKYFFPPIFVRLVSRQSIFSACRKKHRNKSAQHSKSNYVIEVKHSQRDYHPTKSINIFIKNNFQVAVCVRRADRQCENVRMAEKARNSCHIVAIVHAIMSRKSNSKRATRLM